MAPEIAHLIPPQVAPHLAYVPENVRPAHGGGKRRCAECFIACNTAAAGNLAPRDGNGRSLPFPPAFIESHRKQPGQVPAPGRKGTKTAETRTSVRKRPEPEADRPTRRIYSDAGRDW